MKHITLRIEESELLRETDKWSYTVGENIPDEQAKARHFIQGATDRGHAELLRAAADDAWAELMQILSAYTVERCSRCGCNEPCGTDATPVETDGDGAFSVTLHMPDNTYPDIAQAIRRNCFRYLALKMRAEWERLTRQDPAVSDRLAEQTARRLKVEINTRTTQQKLRNTRYGY